MMYSLQILKFLAGVSFFLFGMNFIEGALKHVAGRKFKLLLKKQTSTNLKAVAGGTFLTGIFQSSSIVNSMVLAFVGINVLNIERAIAVILGDNLGTTVDTWFYASAGFGFNMVNIAFGCVGIAGILMLTQKRWFQWSNFLLGIGLLLLGLDFIKTAMAGIVSTVDLSTLNKQPVILFLLLGLAITAVIQSSSATMVILLSALFANAISLYTATALVLGSEIGTTLKFLLASVNGAAVKKRVAWGNSIFNVVSSIILLLFLTPVNYFITQVLGIRNSLIALAFFQSFTNLAGIILFFPFLHYFAHFLEKLFTKKEADTFFIHKVTAENTDLATEAFEKESEFFLYYVIQFSLQVFDIKWPGNSAPGLAEKFQSYSLIEKYDFIKNLHGELLAYYITLQNHSSNKEEAIRCEQIISTVRNSMYAAKSMKDAIRDAAMLKNSSNDLKYNYYLQECKRIESFYTELLEIAQGRAQDKLTALLNIFKKLQDEYEESLKALYQESFLKKLDMIEISSIINFNRQIYTAFKSMGMAVKDFYLNPGDSENLDELPGFIH